MAVNFKDVPQYLRAYLPPTGGDDEEVWWTADKKKKADPVVEELEKVSGPYGGY